MKRTHDEENTNQENTNQENNNKKKKKDRITIKSLPIELLENVVRFSDPHGFRALCLTMQEYSKLVSRVFDHYKKSPINSLEKDERFNCVLLRKYYEHSREEMKKFFGTHCYSLIDIEDHKKSLDELDKKIEIDKELRRLIFGNPIDSDIGDVPARHKNERLKLLGLIEKIENNTKNIDRIEKVFRIVLRGETERDFVYSSNRVNRLAERVSKLESGGHWTVIWDDELTCSQVASGSYSPFEFDQKVVERICIAHMGSKKVGKELSDSFRNYIRTGFFGLDRWIRREVANRYGVADHEYLLYMEVESKNNPRGHSKDMNSVRLYCFGNHKDEECYSRGFRKVLFDKENNIHTLSVNRSTLCLMADSISRMENKAVRHEDIAKEFMELFGIKVSCTFE